MIWSCSNWVRIGIRRGRGQGLLKLLGRELLEFVQQGLLV